MVRRCQRIPLTGGIVGQSAISQAPITGESVPIEKVPGDRFSPEQLNGEGSWRVRVQHRLRAYSTLARIIKLVEVAEMRRHRLSALLTNLPSTTRPVFLSPCFGRFGATLAVWRRLESAG